MADEDYDDLEPLPATLENILAETSLRWIFVGGKGGVGKTTTSCCLAIQLSKVRRNVLIVSTDPAHNLSDAFAQKFGSEPMLVKGFSNLSCMEVEPDTMLADVKANAGGDEGGLNSIMKDLTQAVPGIDEAMSFAEIMKRCQTMDYDCIVFDTAPTGHTLRLLSFPSTLGKAFEKIDALKSRFSGIMGQMGSLLGGALGGGQNIGDMQGQMMEKLEQTQKIVATVNTQFRDPSLTTFVCVCIPEFLSLYETERLVQELTKYGIDVHNIVCNQVLFAETDACRKFLARKKMQDKYLDQIMDLYEDFHVVVTPCMDQEVRGTESLKRFSEYLKVPYEPPMQLGAMPSVASVVQVVAKHFGVAEDDVFAILEKNGLSRPDEFHDAE